MANDVVVFLGPTLPREQAEACLDAICLPPAEQGSLLSAVRMLSPRALVLIDGAFASAPAVRHKEILWALAHGIPVFGASSMGALRAAELSAAGMRGHGFIYRWYALNPLADDDEVAVAMTPAEVGAEALSEALINIRLTLRAARRAGILSEQARHAIEEAARATYFLDRLYPPIIEKARAALPLSRHAELDRFARWWPGNAIDQKREDAIGLLDYLARTPHVLDRPLRLPAFRMTEAWAYDLDAAGLLTDDLMEFAPKQGGR